VDRASEGWWRLDPRTRTVLLALLTTSLLVAVLLRTVLSPNGPPVTVLVASRHLAAGDTPVAEAVTATRWPRTLLPAAAPATRDDLDGARLTMEVTAGTLLTVEHLRDDGPLADLAVTVAAVPVPATLLIGTEAGRRLDLATVAGDGLGRPSTARMR
jgi:Flp pilus assembly protein CpaB